MIPGGAHALMLGGDPCEVYQIGHSVRFNAADSAYLSRNLGAGDTTTWTFSAWVKRALLGASQEIFIADNLANTGSDIVFDASDRLYVYMYASAFVWQAATNRVFRDTAAHFHIQVVLDTNNAVAADRLRIYVNGVRETSFATAPAIALGQTGYINGNTFSHSLSSTRYKFGGYLSNIHFIDGQALDASYFGFVCPSTGQWRPKAYTGTYGINGFHLDFGDGSAATAAALGADRSGNGNNWTPTNISVTVGSGCDWVIDTPTNNFSTLNPLIYDSLPNVPINGALSIVLGNGSNGRLNWSTQAMRAGKWYAEFRVDTVSTNEHSCGIIPASMASTVRNSGNTYVGDKAGEYSYGRVTSAIAANAIRRAGGAYVNNGTTLPVVGDIIGLAFDADAGSLQVLLNNVVQATPGFDSIPAGEYFFTVSAAGFGWSVNFGQQPFVYSPPTDFKSLCTKTLPLPSIKLPSQHMRVKLDTGAAIKATAEAVYPSFLEWIKDRANANNHQLVDSVRGTASVLQSNTTAAEAAYAASAGSSVAWLWRAGGESVANNDGSIASQVSVNAAAGFSVVSYAGTGANATVGHGLGVAPKMVIVKDRAIGNWAVLHGDLVPTEYLLLNGQAAKATGATYWNSAAPTSAVFNLGSAVDVNAAGHNYIAYCFAEVPGFTKFGKYTGNGSADGPFVHCGFRPAFVMIKRADTSGYSWGIYDMVRDPTNDGNNLLLFTDSSLAEVTASARIIDLLSIGFKARGTDAGINASGGTYIFAAFAEFPFKYANAR